MSEAIVARRTRFVDPHGVQCWLKASDFAVLFVATMIVFLGAPEWIPVHAAPLLGLLALEMAIGGVLAMTWSGLYDLNVLLNPRHGVATSLTATAVIGAIVFALTQLGLFSLDSWWLAGWAGVCLVHFALTRTAAFVWARPKAAAGAFRQRVAVVGGGRAGREAVRLLEGADPVRIEVVGLFDDRCGTADAFSYLASEAAEGELDLVLVAIPLANEVRLLQALKRLWAVPVEIRISAQAAQPKLSSRACTYLGKLPLVSAFDRPLNSRPRLKEGLDRAVAALLLLLLLPVLAMAGVAVWLEDRGPVLVRERRFGFDGGAIEVRRMRCRRSCGVSREGALTHVGEMLRKLGLDGAPQLVNVLTGELSLVGPRPHAMAGSAAGNLYQQVVDGYFARHKVKPGLTGWAQINGWPDDVQLGDHAGNRARHDLEYVDRWSLLFDIYILFKVPLAYLKKATAR